MHASCVRQSGLTTSLKSRQMWGHASCKALTGKGLSDPGSCPFTAASYSAELLWPSVPALSTQHHQHTSMPHTPQAQPSLVCSCKEHLTTKHARCTHALTASMQANGLAGQLTRRAVVLEVRLLLSSRAAAATSSGVRSRALALSLLTSLMAATLLALSTGRPAEPSS